MTLQPCNYSSDCQDEPLSPPPTKRDAGDAAKGKVPFLPTQKSGKSLAGWFFSALKHPAVWIPLALLVIATVVFWTTDVDLILSRQFYVEEESSSVDSESHWPLRVVEPWRTLYYLGVYPAWFIGLGGLLVFLMSFFLAKLKPFRDAGLFFALMLALGPGLLINGILKPCWNRPRPHGTIPFGGHDRFVKVGAMGDSAEGASFPSGHASMGFFIMAPGFVLYRRHPRLAAMFFALGIAGGVIMGVTRIVAGSHFASDVVWSAGIVYFTGLGLSALFHFGDDKSIAKQM
jgi:lipid A 4'-phosphatase